MTLFKVQKIIKIFVDLKFAILLLLLIAALSSIGSFIEQDQTINFYEQIIHFICFWSNKTK